MTWTFRGIPHPAETAYTDDIARKSNLLLEAKLLLAQGQNDEATHRFAEAARIETDLANYCDKHGYPESARLHRYSSIGCWAGAGNFYQALADAEVMLRQSDIPDRLRRDIETYAQTIRNKLRQWYEEQVEESEKALV